MKRILKRIDGIIAKIREKKLVFEKVKDVELERLGSDYGGWVIPKNYLNKESICYCVGAGMDITFDLGLTQNYDCKVYILDPTPGALSHYNELVENTKNGTSTYTNTNVEKYNIDVKDLDHLHYFDVGLWDEDTTIKFFVPENKEHISHSALNLQGTNDFFEAKVKKLSSFMKEHNHNHIDLLKIDIEGAEYKVIENLISENLDVGVVCIEFDENIINHLDNNYKDRIQNTLNLLFDSNYLLIHAEKEDNFTFAKKDIVQQLTK